MYSRTRNRIIFNLRKENTYQVNYITKQNIILLFFNEMQVNSNE